ncbi:kinase-like domain-containing protein [Phellopilus nigrolimitatus]|nr:kinase-like domain-containing protein [Phellopilus nigrolimitatus]
MLQCPSPGSLICVGSKPEDSRLGIPFCDSILPSESEVTVINEILAEHACLDLTGKILQESSHPNGLGGFCDVFRGLSLAHGVTVAIKRFRVHIRHDEMFAKSLARELRIWSGLHHPNVLPLLGFTIDDGVYPALISSWMTNGTVIQYLKENPTSSKLSMVKGIALGLCYLHTMGVIHSDMKSDNVLVSKSGTPLLADFGVSRIIIESKSIETKSSLKGSVRWMAIELLSPDLDYDAKRKTPEHRRVLSEQADVWAFGMTVYEILTMLRPYHHLSSDYQVIFAIIRGQLPVLPGSFVSGSATVDETILWDLCRNCWKRSPEMRPSMNDVNRELDWRLSVSITVTRSIKLRG